MKVSVRKVLRSGVNDSNTGGATSPQEAMQFERTKAITDRAKQRQLARKEHEKSKEEKKIESIVEEKVEGIRYKNIRILLLPDHSKEAVLKMLRREEIAFTIIGTDYYVWIKNLGERADVAEVMNRMGDQRIREHDEGFLIKKTTHLPANHKAAERRLKELWKKIEKELQKEM